ncbi:MAG TPA: cupin domain-containing protein [Mycobacteriales bacterium]|nr:cupin domain-containing protein [Mycobacteriales bacterium]
MLVVSETESRTTRTPAATMAGLAAPSQGSAALSSWRVQMEAEVPSPVHVIDREQIWMTVSGTFAFTVDGETGKAEPGQAVIVPAGATRQFHAVGGSAEALVCMPVGGRATMPGSDDQHPLPWAE